MSDALSRLPVNAHPGEKSQLIKPHALWLNTPSIPTAAILQISMDTCILNNIKKGYKQDEFCTWLLPVEWQDYAGQWIVVYQIMTHYSLGRGSTSKPFLTGIRFPGPLQGRKVICCSPWLLLLAEYVEEPRNFIYPWMYWLPAKQILYHPSSWPLAPLTGPR